MTISNKRREYSNSTGRVAEVRFKRAAESLGFRVDKSRSKEDIHHHIDFWLHHSGKKYSVDVKGNNLPDEIWCEFKNVKGERGWMYGMASIIAFDMPEEGGFSVVNRDELVKWCEKNIDDTAVDEKSQAYRKRYSRKGRADVVTRITLKDLRSISSYRVWAYLKDYES
jgi:hypothetical protein